MEGDNLTRWRRAPFSSSTELRASGRPTLRNRWRSVVLGRSILMLAVRSCTGRALVARSTRCLELVRPLDVPLNAPKARPMPAALHGCPSGLVRGKNSKNSKNFRELQALDFVASSALLTGCTSRRMAAALAASWGVQRVILTRSWPISRVRNLKIFRVDQQSLSSLRCAIDCSSLRKMSAALGASWGVQRVDLADLVAKSPDLVEMRVRDLRAGAV